MTNYLKQGQELLKIGQIKEAIDLFHLAINSDASSPWPYYHLALALMKDGQLEGAVSQLQRSIKIDPELIWAHHYLGETLVKLGQLEEAVGKFERAIELKPDLSWSYHHLGETLFKLGRWDEAIVNWRKAIGLNPQFINSNERLAKVSQKLDRAANILEKYRHQAKDLGYHDLEVISSLQLDLQKLARSSGQKTELTTTGKLISFAGNQSWVFFGPYINLSDGLYGISINFELPKLINIKETKTVCFKFDIVSDGGHCSWYEREIYPNQNQLVFTIELINCNHTEFRFFATGVEFVINSIELTLLHQPSKDTTKAADYYLNIGQKNISKPDKAVYAYRKAIELNPNFIDRAIECYYQSITLHPNHYDFHNDLGELLAKQGQLDKATECYRSAIKLNPIAEDCYCQLARILEAQGKQNEAIYNYRLASVINHQLTTDNNRFNNLEPIHSWLLNFEKFYTVTGQRTKVSGSQMVSLSGNQGFVFFGPYIDLPDGLYRFKLEFELPKDSKISDNSFNIWFKFDVVYGGAACTWYNANVDINQKQADFYLELVYAKGIEVRFFALGTEFAINTVEIQQLSQPNLGVSDANHYFDIGKIWQSQDNLELAIFAYCKAASLLPETYLEISISVCQKLIQIRPNWLKYFRLGMLLAENGRLEEAVHCYEKALQTQPNLAANYIELKNILLDSGLEEQLINCYRKAFNGEVYDRLWQSINNLNTLSDEDENQHLSRIIPSEAYEYFQLTSQYKVMNMSSLNSEDKTLLNQIGISVGNLELIAKDEIEWEEECINNFPETQTSKLLRNTPKKLRVPVEGRPWYAGQLNQGRYYQQSIVETGYIYSVCPINGNVLRSNQSFTLHDPHRCVGGCWFPIHIYRFVGKEVFYLICASYIADKSFIYMPKWELIVIISQVPVITEVQMINMFKCEVVSCWPKVKKYISDDRPKQIAANLAWDGNLGHFLQNDLTGLLYLLENETLQKVDKFLLGFAHFLDVGEIFPEIREKILQLKNPQELFDTILDNNYFAVWVTDVPVKDKLAKRISWAAIKKCDLNFLLEVEDAKKCFPLLLIQLRIHLRVWLSQTEGIVNIIKKLSADFPNLGIVFDGWGRLENYSPIVESRSESIIKKEQAMLQEILEQIPSHIKIYSSIGSNNHEKVVWANAVDTFIGPGSSGCFWMLWIANKLGVVHINKGPIHGFLAAVSAREKPIYPICVSSYYSNVSEDQGFGPALVNSDYDCHWQEIYQEVYKIVNEISKDVKAKDVSL